MAFQQQQQQAAGGDPYANPNNDYSVGPTVADGIQDLAWSPTADVLVAASWDGLVRCWQVQKQGQQLHAAPQAQISHDGPVLCAAFSGVRGRGCRRGPALATDADTRRRSAGRRHRVLGLM
jgi:WD40 repeat protein